MKSFYGVTGEDDDFQYTHGHERIPDNWYTRNADDAYSIVYLSSDDLEMVLQHLDLDSVGGNTGTVDSFTGVDISNLTGGVFNAATSLGDNNLLCFAMVRTQSHVSNGKIYANGLAVCPTAPLQTTRHSKELTSSPSPACSQATQLCSSLHYSPANTPFTGNSPSSKYLILSPASSWMSMKLLTTLGPYLTMLQTHWDARV